MIASILFLTRLLSFVFSLGIFQPVVSLALVDAQTHIDAITVSGILFERDGKTICVSTVTHGLLRSRDGGKSWAHINRGIIDPLIYQIVQPPRSQGVLYAASWGGGVYRSEDGGEGWMAKNQGLTATAVGALAIHPDRPQMLFAATSQGVYRSAPEGDRWFRWNEGLDGEKDLAYNTLTVAPGDNQMVFLGTDRGIWQRGLSDRQWTFSGIRGADVRIMKYDAGTSSVFAGTGYGGFFQGRRDLSPAKFQWLEVNPTLRKYLIQSILLSDRGGKKVIYLGTSDQGVLRSEDGGKRWEARNHGIAQEEIKALAVDPTDSRRILAGSRDSGVFQSRDEGVSWASLNLPPLTLAQVVDSSKKNAEAAVKGRRPQPPPPAAFQRCNECHGWADPVLHLHPQTYWRVSPSHRDWNHTVERMARGTKWQRADKRAIIEYMNRYYGER